MISAHRQADALHRYVAEAEAAGVRLFIGAAGLAAHLPGVLASLTARPVIGIPLDGGALGGADALYAVVQMPPGVPVASVAIGSAGARNAGHLAARILALSDADGGRARGRLPRRAGDEGGAPDRSPGLSDDRSLRAAGAARPVRRAASSRPVAADRAAGGRGAARRGRRAGRRLRAHPRCRRRGRRGACAPDRARVPARRHRLPALRHRAARSGGALAPLRPDQLRRARHGDRGGPSRCCADRRA